MSSDIVSEKVKSFYVDLPFNYSQSAQEAASRVRAQNSIPAYTPLNDLISAANRRVLDVGCGPGWLALNMAFHYKADVTGVDFNPVALERACEVARLLDSNAQFHQADLFKYVPEQLFSLVTSIGVLHHTSNCIGAIRHIADRFVAPGGYLYIGLYHAYGRKPFLDHFKRLQQQGHDRSQLIREYARLDPRFADDPVHFESWYRDQVEHPHETQHTLKELLPIFDEAGFQTLGTSLSSIHKSSDLQRIAENEWKYEQEASKQLKKGKYCPGFFTVWAQKK